jgi:hypothetical protein
MKRIAIFLALTSAALAQRSGTVELVNPWSWSKGGFDSILLVSLSIRNTKAVDVKDITVHCSGFAESGTRIDANERIIYRVFRAGQTTRVTGFNMGFLHSQVTSIGCHVVDSTPLTAAETSLHKSQAEAAARAAAKQRAREAAAEAKQREEEAAQQAGQCGSAPGEYAVLASGARLRIDRHETDGSQVRLYHDGGFVLMDVGQIAAFQPCKESPIR